MNLYKYQKCDYCGEEGLCRQSPYAGESHYKICKGCWDEEQEEYAAETNRMLPNFEDGLDYEEEMKCLAPEI